MRQLPLGIKKLIILIILIYGEPHLLLPFFTPLTIILQYKKPKEILQMEKEIQEELKKLKASKDGDVDCTPS